MSQALELSRMVIQTSQREFWTPRTVMILASQCIRLKVRSLEYIAAQLWPKGSHSHVLPTQCSMAPCWSLKTSHNNTIYTTETYEHPKQGFPMPHFWQLAITMLQCITGHNQAMHPICGPPFSHRTASLSNPSSPCSTITTLLDPAQPPAYKTKN